MDAEGVQAGGEAEGRRRARMLRPTPRSAWRGGLAQEGWEAEGGHTCTKMTAALTISRGAIGLMDESLKL